MNPIALATAVCVLGVALPSFAGQSCVVKSGAATAALVELYTSEGCSSCPPADRQLNQLQQQVGATAVVVPLALHVTYWNDLGWKDFLSQKTFDVRQSALLDHRKSSGVVYTPQFFVNGAELRGWRNALPPAIRKINAKPAPLAITLKTMPAGDSIMIDADVHADVSTQDPDIDGTLYLAVSESGLVTRVRNGENSGTTLQHDDAARVLLGPLQLTHGNGHLQQKIAIPSSWNRQHLQVVAFVQDQKDGRILQAVSTQQCTQTRG